MARNIILTGGIGHPFASAAPALRDALAEAGIESALTEDIEGGLAETSRTRPALLTVYALRWTMAGSAKYAALRAQTGFSLSAAGRSAIAAHLARGGGLLALHTALVCFDDWPGWRDTIGAAWAWGRSSHPPYGPVEVRRGGTDHPIMAGIGAFGLTDEVYGDLDWAGPQNSLLEARAAGGAWHPVMWVRQAGPGRVVCDALGHDAGVFVQPDHRRVVRRAALWALGRGDAEIAAA